MDVEKYFHILLITTVAQHKNKKIWQRETSCESEYLCNFALQSLQTEKNPHFIHKSITR